VKPASARKVATWPGGQPIPRQTVGSCRSSATPSASAGWLRLRGEIGFAEAAAGRAVRAWHLGGAEHAVPIGVQPVEDFRGRGEFFRPARHFLPGGLEFGEGDAAATIRINAGENPLAH